MRSRVPGPGFRVPGSGPGPGPGPAKRTEISYKNSIKNNQIEQTFLQPSPRARRSRRSSTTTSTARPSPPRLRRAQDQAGAGGLPPRRARYDHSRDGAGVPAALLGRTHRLAEAEARRRPARHPPLAAQDAGPARTRRAGRSRWFFNYLNKLSIFQ